MRHGKKFNHLSRTAPHRKAMLSNMACSLIEHKRINTTVAKAKALRGFVEPILTKSKVDSTHNRRVAFTYLRDKNAVSELFRDIAPKIAERQGGYTRIIKLGHRQGDSAEMCMIELVDFNELMLAEKSKKKSTRRSRRGGSKSKSTGTDAVAGSTPANADTGQKEESAVVAEKSDEKVETKAETTPEVKEESPKTEANKEEAPKAEVKKEESTEKEAKTETKAEATPEAPVKEKKEEPKEEKKEVKAEKPAEEKKDDNPEKDDKKEEGKK